MFNGGVWQQAQYGIDPGIVSWSRSTSNPWTTQADGAFGWNVSGNNTYRLKANAEGYIFPSNKTAVDLASFGRTLEGNKPDGGSWGGTFTITTGTKVVDIPVDYSIITSGSSGHGKHEAWYKPQTWSCGCLGLEALLLVFIIGLLRRRFLRFNG